MLTSSHRLNRRALQRVYRHGRAAKTDALGVRYLANHHGKPRYAVVVAKKVNKGAVARNRLRRRLVAQLAKQLPTTLAQDVIVSPLRDLSAMSPAELQKELTTALNRASLV